MILKPSSSEEPLNLGELKILDAFLRMPFAKANPMNLTKSHGFITGIVSSPHPITFMELVSILMGGEADFVSREEAQVIMGLISRLKNCTNKRLQKKENFKLLLWSLGKTIPFAECSFELLAEWCKGYLEATYIDVIWASSEHRKITLLPFGVLSNEFSLKGQRDGKGKIITDDKPHKLKHKKKLISHIQSNYDYWRDYLKHASLIYDE